MAKKEIISLANMELAIAKYFGWRTNIIVPNVSWGANIHECDIFIIKPSGYAIEVEIKRSKQDLKANFKKKHNHSGHRISELYYAIPNQLYESCKELIPDEAGIILVSILNNVSCCSIVKPAKKNKRVKLTQKEICNISRLGVMRIWGLKSKLLSKQ